MKKYLLLISLMVCAIAAKANLSVYDLNKPFGWVNCTSQTSGDSYETTGGGNGSKITLTSTGKDMKTEISNALKNYDIIVFDGSEGDFILSSYIKMDKLKDKTLVGINGARLCTEFYVTKEITDLLDANKVPDMSTSGGGGTLPNGTKVTEEAEYMTRKLIMEHTGDTKENYRNAGIFYISGCSNIVVRNLKFVGPGSIDVGGSDLLSSVNGTTHLWVDHCEFTDGQDGNFDITQKSDFVTVSWCKFSYTDRSYMHQNTNLIGSSDSSTADEDLLNVTFAFNIWGAKCRARMPMGRFGTIHMLNNYYDCAGNATACINPRKNSEFLIEGNFFAKGVTKIFDQKDAKAYNWTSDNFTTEKFSPQNKGTVIMPYEYSIVEAILLPEILTGENGAGATLSDPLSMTGTSDLSLPISSNGGERIYDICGRQVKSISHPGIYIIGGKKVVIQQTITAQYHTGISR